MQRNLSTEDRKMIEYGIRLNWSNSVISDRICRDASTIGEENREIFTKIFFSRTNKPETQKNGRSLDKS